MLKKVILLAGIAASLADLVYKGLLYRMLPVKVKRSIDSLLGRSV